MSWGVSHRIWCPSGSSHGIYHLWCHEGSHTLSDVTQEAAMDEPSLMSWGGLTPYLMSPRKQPWMNYLWCPEGVSHLIWCHSGSSYGINHFWCPERSHTLSDVPQGAAMDEPSLMPWRVSHLIWRQWLSKHDWIHLTIPSTAPVGAETACGSKISCHVICLNMWLRRKDCAELKHAWMWSLGGTLDLLNLVTSIPCSWLFIPPPRWSERFGCFAFDHSWQLLPYL